MQVGSFIGHTEASGKEIIPDQPEAPYPQMDRVLILGLAQR